jgi:NTE family protein
MTAHPQSAEFETPIARQKSINLALQGGGSHGAFTWGVLDRLLEEDQLTIDGISATSAGSINAVVVACGLAVGGRAEAKRALKHFWRRLSTMAASSILQPSIVDKMMGNFGLDYSGGYLLTNILCQLLSPYQFNPLNLSPLKHLLEETVDFRRIRQQTAVKLFLCATNVQTCKVEIFRGQELTADHVLASSCLPFLMHAVEIGGERYWDGGFIANPALFPLIYECDARDIILVHVTPSRRPGFPVTANSILSRMQEVSPAIWSRSTFAASFTLATCTFKISRRPVRSGRSTSTCRSNRPGRSSAGSSTSGRLVAAIRITPVLGSKPSNSASS